jgi:hypothetical protein
MKSKVFIFILFVVWISYTSLLLIRIRDLIIDGMQDKYIIKYQNVIINIQRQALDSAVYFNDIKLRNNKNKPLKPFKNEQIRKNLKCFR